MAVDPLNQMIQDLCRSPEGIRRLNDDPEGVFEEYGLNEEQKAALREGAPLDMVKAGVHPILSMHYLFARNPQMSVMMSIMDYPELKEDGE